MTTVFSDSQLEKRRRWAKRELVKLQHFNPIVFDKEVAERMAILKDWPEHSRLKRLIERDGLYCCWCGTLCDPRRRPSADIFPTVEHVIRKADGGTSGMHNLKVACRKCNNSRHHANWKPIHREAEP